MNDKKYLELKLIKTAIVMHDGWEMDNEAWVKEDNNRERYLITTSHGSLTEMTLEELDLKIEETQRSVSELSALRELVT
tara:strand:- start:10 stop:246 length:237 start_codon:yes stop_codon:yes gene_type:complete